MKKSKVNTSVASRAVIQSSEKGKVKKASNVKYEIKFSPKWVAENGKAASGYKLQMIDLIRKGVKKMDWKSLISFLESTEKEFEPILPVSISSMQKKKVYDKETSERIYELARLFGLGYEVFDSKEDFKYWLTSPSKVFDNRKPFELLDSSFGFELVEREIVRIQYNVYS